MNVVYYCQHVLGIGHFHRSIEICKAIASHHPTTLIIGGPPVTIDHPGIQVVKLPGLQMDSEFNNLVPCDTNLLLAEVKKARKEQLFSYFQQHSPDVFITELYPFGRKAFRFELDPLLEAIRDGSLSKCACYCSVRDILVEKKTGWEKFERRVVQTVNTYFDGILVHADPEIITLDETFSRLSDIQIPLHYTGFITKPEVVTKQRDGQEPIRKKLALLPADKLIVASIGGGNVGSELLYAAIHAFKLIKGPISGHLQLFCGPYCDEKTYTALQDNIESNITIDRFTDRFPEWLATADISLSMAGYNTCMNLVQAGVPALVYPFKQNREQRLRAKRLARKVPMTILEETDLAPHLLSKKIILQLQSSRFKADINLNGAKETAGQLARWSAEYSSHD